MHIVVCIKQVPDPEVAPGVFHLDALEKKMVIPGRSPVINPFDEQAIEAALRIRESSADPEQIMITAITMADTSPAKTIKHVLAMGADEGIVLTDSAFADSDSYSTAYALASAIKSLGEVDLIFTGRQAADSDSGVVGLGVAELLGFPAVTFAKEINMVGEEIVVERVVGNGQETIVSPLPVVVTITHEFGSVRHPNLRETMKASKKPVRNLTPESIGIDPSCIGAAGARSVVVRLYKPAQRTDCEWLSGDDTTAVAGVLAAKLLEQKLL